MACLLGFVNIEKCTNNTKGLNAQFLKIKQKFLIKSLAPVNQLEINTLHNSVKIILKKM